MNGSGEDVRQQIERNAADAGMLEAKIMVASSQFGGYLIRVVHRNLTGLSDERRRELLLRGMDEDVVDAELITPEEEEWYGEPFAQNPYLPLWAEALRRSDQAAELRFVSDEDADLERPAVATFYSLRGGVGRTTALVNAARILAGYGRRVVCVDMDLEAPGLSTLLGLSEPDSDVGTVPLLLSLERDEDVDVRDHIQRASEEFELYCLPAGRVSAEYAERLRLIDPEIWYREAKNPLHRMLDLISTSSLNPDLIILDARTGISPVNAPLLFDVSDLAVICFFPHMQAKRGTGELVGALLNARSRRSSERVNFTPEPRFLVSPLPPGPSSAQVVTRAAEWIDGWLEPAEGRRPKELGALVAGELMHSVSYAPEVAFRDAVSLDPNDWGPYGEVAEWLEQLLPPFRTEEPSLVPSINKSLTLDELKFSTGTAETQATLADDFVITRLTSQALSPDVPLVIGRKGTGKTAVFRRLLETSHPSAVPICCPQTFLDRFRWVLGAEGFTEIESDFEASGSTWRSFWPAYTALALHLALPEAERVSPPARLAVDLSPFLGAYGELEVVDTLKHILRQPESGLLTTRWLQDYHQFQKSPRILLFDGLDTGFGGAESRDLRARAVEGLLQFSTGNETRLGNLAFKILLRADIWQQLRFDNKSHLFGRSVQLAWRNQAEYFKTVLKQAARSSTFSQSLRSVGASQLVDEWDDEEVARAWNLLVGERMKGGKTTFTRNWVWNRLADGQGDHGPRTLSQLFHEAAKWEKIEESRIAYGRSILRPRALVPSLDTVSEEALQALVEEFPELQDIIDVLIRLGRTPVDARDLTHEGASAAALSLALEIGLLAVYEGTAEEVRRYRVPDLYRVALRMTRKGQA